MILNNSQMFISTAIGIVIGLLFDDLRKLFVNELLVKIVDKYIIKEETIRFVGVELKTKKIINLFLTIILAIIVLILLDKYVY